MSQYADRSNTERTRRIRSRILSATTTANKKPVDYDVLQAIYVGRSGYRTQPASGGPVYDVAGCCPISCDAASLEIFTSGFLTPAPPYDVSYNILWDISWNPVPGATSYSITVTTLNTEPYLVVSTGLTSASFYVDFTTDSNAYQLTVTANAACPASSSTDLFPCFLAGSQVQMADGSQKAIEDVAVGDLVLGAFGEINTVLALHRPLLGSARMNRINDEHSTTAHHPHISADRGFYCAEPSVVEASTYGHEHDVIDGSGCVVKRMLHGLKKGRIQQLDLGVVLKTVEGSRPVASLETYSLPPDTQLYNLVIGGSHTYHVDGYAVTGWPREDDWDYDTWAAKL
jgi:hypothetical protein